MSNTGHKGITASFDKKGKIRRFQVYVGWKGKERRLTIMRDDLGGALAARDDFERELNKPRTDIRILPGDGVAVDKRNGVNGSAVWRATVRAHGRRYSTQFSIEKHGYQGARLLALAWREKKLDELIRRSRR